MANINIRVQNLEQPIDVAEYLFRRLHEIGVRSVHGLPGDYNLLALDYLPSCGLKWVGSVNELNAAYAADGYARVKKMGALITTFGVGELSAINGIAGAFSEHIPVVHIVGCPSTISQRNGMLLHHTLGNGDFNVFANMSAQISCEVAKLTNPAEIATQIDHALRVCFIRSRPVYIMLPTDMVECKVEGARLKEPIDLSEPENEPESEAYVVDVVLKYLRAAKNPIILVDACAIRHRVLEEVHDLIEKTNLPVFVTPMGKGAVNEEHPTYGGVYAGDGSHPHQVKEIVESSDLILTIGALKSDFNTAGFSYRTSQLNTIDLHSDHCVVKYSTYPGVQMRGVLRQVIKKISASEINVQPAPVVENEVTKNLDPTSTITQAWFWPRIGEFLQKKDIVITETGTANFGIWDTKFPSGVTALSQVLWGSIGWSVGACQGAALAAADDNSNRRTILFVGDGSFQLTAQELSTMIRLKLKPIIFVICNDGFTIERFIHGMEAEYNDIANWDFKALVDVFGGSSTAKKFVVKSKEELENLLTDASFNAAECLQFVELYMPKEGTAGRWKTPAQKAKQAGRVEMGTALDVGDEGIWVTYARGMKGKAVREFKALCEEYGEKLYGIKPPADEAEAKSGDEEEDIEASIQRELDGMKASQKPRVRGVFSPVSVGIECVFFMKTMRPVDPCQLVLQICKDAQECPGPKDRKCKYINRMTPVVDTEKATEKGIERVARKVLASFFSLNEEEKEAEGEEQKPVEGSDETEEVKETTKAVEPEAEEKKAEASSAFTYAIRHTMRNHTILKSEAVIKLIAGMIKPEHKVNLRTPDKVILVEIFQMFCGISVVDGKEWEELKRYNINALYDMTGEQKSGGGGKAAKTE
ncbi:pyruvate decarboxylase [Trichoderma arundinaceum]|uniref:Pyruvate decarboxylase n=1 Tax=Trichoderma arundinaceum TaxID=490622 RepID=A0A395NB40_TRIAR|nr:pyruvate decarboxylase [Trichoderma arundinaceum]